jgi:polar amino acid transport system substrate-binding protein
MTIPNLGRLLIASIAALSLVLAGCVGDSGSTGATDLSVAQVATIEPGTLTVCVTDEEPFGYQTDEGDWTGFDLDLMEAMAADMDGGLTLRVIDRPFDKIWLAPADGSCDLVAAALTITPERAKSALFTDPYFTASQSLMVLQSRAAELTGLDALSGSTIGSASGSTGVAYAEANAPEGATVVGYANQDLLYAALDDGKIDAVIQDLPVSMTRLSSHPGKYALVGEFDTGERYGFAMAKGNTALANSLNQLLERVRANGVLQAIYDRYFGLATTP